MTAALRSGRAASRAVRLLLALAALSALLLIVLPAHARRARASRRPRAAAPALPADCAWRVADLREPREHEDAWEARHPLLRDPLDPNRVPGLPPLVASVRTDGEHHPHLFLDNVARGTTRALGGSRWLSQPRWSPDGRTLACTVWKGRAEPWALCLIDAESGRVTEVAHGLNASAMRWAPDSKTLAVAGTRVGRDRVVLGAVSAADGEARWLDSLGVFADYDFSWSPDARTLAVMRPTELAVGQELTGSQLWLVSLDGTKCPLVATPGNVVREPRWVDARRLRFVEHRARQHAEQWQSRLAVIEPRNAQP